MDEAEGLCEVLRMMGLPLQARYTTAETASIFESEIRGIRDHLPRDKWPVRDLPQQGRF